MTRALPRTLLLPHGRHAKARPVAQPTTHPTSPEHRRAVGFILGTAAALFFALLVARVAVLGWRPHDLLEPWEVAKMAMSGVYDFVYVAAATAPFLVGVHLARRRTWVLRLMCAAYALIAAASLAAGMANVAVVRSLGRPFNWRWFYYSDFLGSLDAKRSLGAEFSWGAAAVVLGAVALSVAAGGAAALAAVPLARRWRRLRHRLEMPRRLAPLAGLAAAAVYVAWSHHFLVEEQWPTARTANPVVEFVRSVATTQGADALFTMKTSADNDDFEPHAAANPPEPGAAARAGGRPVRNVVLFVLESVPAEYVDVYGSPYGVTPNLAGARRSSAVFANVYAHAPATNYSMVSMLCSLYPPLSYRSVTQERPAIDAPSLSSELKSLGHANGLFYSADLRFQRSEAFLARRGFGEVQDCRTIRRTRGVSADTSSAGGEAFASGDFADDADTVDAAVEWISARASRPFFAMVWTGNTHHPYVAPPGEQASFGVSDAAHNRYLNALRRADEALGSLLAALRRLGVEDDTLVVVVGDHGEAFGRHGQSGHASMLYEENVHVPFVLINPRLFKGETYETVGGLVDVAPTVLDLMALPAPPRWQGRSLFDPGRGGRTYFFAPWSDYLFGMREGNLKTIYNATTGSHEVYDLSADPRETKNLATDMPDVVNAAQQRLAAWVQYQGQLYKTLGDRDQDAAARQLVKD